MKHESEHEAMEKEKMPPNRMAMMKKMQKMASEMSAMMDAVMMGED